MSGRQWERSREAAERAESQALPPPDGERGFPKEHVSIRSSSRLLWITEHRGESVNRRDSASVRPVLWWDQQKSRIQSNIMREFQQMRSPERSVLRRAEEQGYRGTGGRRRVRTVTSEGTYEQNGGERDVRKAKGKENHRWQCSTESSRPSQGRRSQSGCSELRKRGRASSTGSRGQTATLNAF